MGRKCLRAVAIQNFGKRCGADEPYLREGRLEVHYYEKYINVCSPLGDLLVCLLSLLSH